MIDFMSKNNRQYVESKSMNTTDIKNPNNVEITEQIVEKQPLQHNLQESLAENADDKKTEPLDDSCDKQEEPEQAIVNTVDIDKIEQAEEDTKVCEVKEGMIVKLKDSVKYTVTGMEIPEFAYKNTYNVEKVLPRRIIIKCNNLIYAVTTKDIIV